MLEVPLLCTLEVELASFTTAHFLSDSAKVLRSLTKPLLKCSTVDPPFYRSTIESGGHSLDCMMHR